MKTRINPSPLFLDMLSRHSSNMIVENRFLFLNSSYYQKYFKYYYTEIISGRKKIYKLLDVLEKNYDYQQHEGDLFIQFGLNKNRFKNYVHISIIYQAAQAALLDYIKVPSFERYNVYYLLSHPLRFSKTLLAKKHLVDIALQIERNKTLKKSFTSSPEKIMDKLKTFYINIYNNILLYLKKYLWVKSSTSNLVTFDEIELLRDLKFILKESNIKREYALIESELTNVKKDTKHIIRKYKITNKLLNISNVMRKINYLVNLRDEYMIKFLFDLRPQLSKILNNFKLEERDILKYNLNQYSNMLKGKSQILKLPKVISYQLNKKLVIKSFQKLEWKKRIKKISCITNFDKIVKGEIGNNIITINKETYSNDDFGKVLCVLDKLNIYSFYYSHIKVEPLIIDVPILSYLTNGTKLKIDGKNQIIKVIY